MHGRILTARPLGRRPCTEGQAALRAWLRDDGSYSKKRKRGATAAAGHGEAGQGGGGGRKRGCGRCGGCLAPKCGECIPCRFPDRRRRCEQRTCQAPEHEGGQVAAPVFREEVCEIDDEDSDAGVTTGASPAAALRGAEARPRASA